MASPAAQGTFFSIAALAVQSLFILLFALAVRYSDDAANNKTPVIRPTTGAPSTGTSSATGGNQTTTTAAGSTAAVHTAPVAPLSLSDTAFDNYYPMFQDVHVMIVVGFGFLMCFMKRHGYTAVGFTLFIAALCLQWHMLIFGWLHQLFSGHAAFEIKIDVSSMIMAEFTAGTVLISFGSVIGKVGALQLLILMLIEVVLAKINECIIITLLQIQDIGGSIVIHTFGAYFGLAAALALRNHYALEKAEKMVGASIYHADLFSMIGTTFLWLFWPSFNGAFGHAGGRHRAILNTYLALAGSALATYIFSSLTNPKRKFKMEHVQNATLAGGVAIGATADMMVGPWLALLIGFIAGTVSTLGYRFLTPILESRIKLHDTCGIHNLHGMPGVIGGLFAILIAGLANEETYGVQLYQMYLARAPQANTTEFAAVSATYPDVTPGMGRSAAGQAVIQLVGLCITLGFAIVGGGLTGLLLRLPFLSSFKSEEDMFEDSTQWEVAEDYAKMGSELQLCKKVHEAEEGKNGEHVPLKEISA